MKKAISILLAAMMVLSLSVVAFAAPSTEWDVPVIGVVKATRTLIEDDQLPEDVKDAALALKADPKSNESVADVAEDKNVKLDGWYDTTKGTWTYAADEVANVVCVLFIANGSTDVQVLTLDGNKVVFPAAGISADVVVDAEVESPAA